MEQDEENEVEKLKWQGEKEERELRVEMSRQGEKAERQETNAVGYYLHFAVV